MRTALTLKDIRDLVEGSHHCPRSVLGPHEVEHDGRRAVAVRAFLPDTQQAWVIESQLQPPRPMRQLHPAGLFEAICPLPERQARPRYQLRCIDGGGATTTLHDPYAFDSLLSDYDRHLFAEGNHEQLYNKLGAQLCRVEGVLGTHFAVWAPQAFGVAVIGEFNDWHGHRHMLQKHSDSGIWELFVPAASAGQLYKFRVTTADGRVVDKTDPFGFAAEIPPRTASRITDLGKFRWSDQEWIDRRARRNPVDRPISVYEVHLASWRRGPEPTAEVLNYRELAHQLVDYCRRLSFTHVELLPISEHPFSGSWGYQTVGYYAVTSRYGTPEDFQYFVDYCHRHGIGVILDWVPAHFPRDDHGLARFDGANLYEHPDPRLGEHPDWGTLIFDYGRNEVRNFLLANALFWFDKYHVDGLRVDAVASMLYRDYSRSDGEWLPNADGGRENLEAVSLLQKCNDRIHGSFPGVLTIAEESTSWRGVSHPTCNGGLGFSLKWNMGWMNDSLSYMRRDSVHRQFHHDQLTFSLMYSFSEKFALPFSHDEVVHGKGALVDQMPGDVWQKFANLRLLYAYMWTHPGKKLLFMGNEFAVWKEWNHETELAWDLLQTESHRGIQSLVTDLNQMYCQEPALHEMDHEAAGFDWIDCSNREQSVLIYQRNGLQPGEQLVVCCNFTPVVREDFEVDVPQLGWYREILNTDSRYYGGSNVGNHPGLPAMEERISNGRYTIRATLPPLATVVFKHTARSDADGASRQ